MDPQKPVEFESVLEDYPVRVLNFEGPLDLLLHLIKANEVNIYDIPITLVTQQYLDYLDLMQEMNLEVAGEFLVMAATLMEIKNSVEIMGGTLKNIVFFRYFLKRREDVFDMRDEMYRFFKKFCINLGEFGFCQIFWVICNIISSK